MAIDPVRLKQLFQGAIAIPDQEQRSAWLIQECGTDAELLAKLQALLIARDDPESFLDRLAPPASSHTEETGAFTPNQDAANSVPLPSSQEKPGHVVGRYKLLEAIGEGGMGSVWMAEQREPVKRLVALKLIKAGMDTRAVLTRFEAERQALALMDHPNIAKVLDGGTTESGRPFFVMELVKGLPLTEYSDSRKLNVKDRLQLFIQICSAVQHAHQKGIIHRDLKPSNVLVTEHDGRPVPKVIDFGLAKALNATNMLTDRTLHTAYGTVVGTPLYMAPEQVGINALDTDTRSDVYALGVMLYELLTGTTPLEKQRFKEAAWDEVKRIIQEEEPPRPSMRLSSSDTLPNLAANRQVEPAKLSNLIKGELDWIVMKALEKDRNRRYETANGFARDIQRYLSDEVVEARPASAGYRLKKLVSRNKGRVLAALLVFLALLTGVAVSTWQAVRATRAEQLAVQAQHAEEERAEGERVAKLDAQDKQNLAVAAAEKERQAKEEAIRNLAFAKKGNEILASVFSGLDPKANYATVAELRNVLRGNLAKAVKELDGSAIGDPLEVAKMQNTLGLSLLGLGEPDKAIVVLEKARATCESKLGSDNSATLLCMNSLGMAYLAAKKLDQALFIFEETLRKDEAIYGKEHRNTINAMGCLADAYQASGKMDLALPLLEKTLKQAKINLGPEHPSTLTFMGNLAAAYGKARKFDLALPLCEETLRLEKKVLGPQHPSTLVSMSNLAGVYAGAGKFDLALPLCEESLKLIQSILGAEHPNTLHCMDNLARIYLASEKWNKALPLFEHLLKIQKARLGPDHRDTLIGMFWLAHTYKAVGKLDQAIPLFEEALNRQKTLLGGDDSDTFNTMQGLAESYQAKEQQKKAMLLYEETLKHRRATLGSNHPDTLLTMNNLAVAYFLDNQLDKSVSLFEEVMKHQEVHLGRGHKTTLATMANLGKIYMDLSRLPEAIPLLEEAHRATNKYPQLRLFDNDLLEAYILAGKPVQGFALVKELEADARKSFSKDSPQLAQQLASIGFTLLQSKAYAEADPFLRECLAIREKKEPDDWRTFNTQSILGGALLGQKKYTEAEPLLLKGYDGLKAREKTIPPQGIVRLPEALDRLIQLYTETNKPDEVKKWQAEKNKLPKTLEKKN